MFPAGTTISGYGKLVLPVMQIQEDLSPRITSVNPQRVQYSQIITIQGTGFGADRGTSKVIFHEDKQLQYSSQYVHWSDTRIQVRVPTGARSGPLQVITDRGSDTFELTVTSPWVSNISLQRRSTDILVYRQRCQFWLDTGKQLCNSRIGNDLIVFFLHMDQQPNQVLYSAQYPVR